MRNQKINSGGGNASFKMSGRDSMESHWSILVLGFAAVWSVIIGPKNAIAKEKQLLVFSVTEKGPYGEKRSEIIKLSRDQWACKTEQIPFWPMKHKSFVDQIWNETAWNELAQQDLNQSQKCRSRFEMKIHNDFNDGKKRHGQKDMKSKGVQSLEGARMPMIKQVISGCSDHPKFRQFVEPIYRACGRF
jgi:hypothetical protein